MIKTLFESDMFVGLFLTIGGGLLLLYAIKTRNKYKLFTYGFDWTIDKFGLSILLIIIGIGYICSYFGLI